MPVTAMLIEPDTSRPITTGPGSSGTLPQAISAALCSAVLIFCGTSSLAFMYAARNWYGNCRERRISSGSAKSRRIGQQARYDIWPPVGLPS